MRKLEQEARTFLDAQGRRFNMKADRLCEGAGNLTRNNDGTATSAWPEPFKRIPGLCIVKYQEPSFVYFRSIAISSTSYFEGLTGRFEPLFDKFVLSAAANELTLRHSKLGRN